MRCRCHVERLKCCLPTRLGPFGNNLPSNQAHTESDDPFCDSSPMSDTVMAQDHVLQHNNAE